MSRQPKRTRVLMAILAIAALYGFYATTPPQCAVQHAAHNTTLRICVD